MSRCWVGRVDEHTVEGEFLGIMMHGHTPMAVVRFKGMEIKVFGLERVRLGGKPTAPAVVNLRKEETP